MLVAPTWKVTAVPVNSEIPLNEAAVRDLVDAGQNRLILAVDRGQLRAVVRSVSGLGGELLRGLQQVADV